MDIAEAVTLAGKLNQELAVAEARHEDAKGALQSLEAELQAKYKTIDQVKLTGMQQKAESDLEALLEEVSQELEAVPEA